VLVGLHGCLFGRRDVWLQSSGGSWDGEVGMAEILGGTLALGAAIASSPTTKRNDEDLVDEDLVDKDLVDEA
jgi:hypothetical protein